MAYASLLMDNITSWDDFHRASRTAFGFPEFYGDNNNAWVDCLSYLDQDDGLSAFVLDRDEVLELLLADYSEFAEKHPDIALGITQLVATVNSRYSERGDFLRVRLVLT
jgi:hypothetical protein